jgi:hypothetical protein
LSVGSANLIPSPGETLRYDSGAREEVRHAPLWSYQGGCGVQNRWESAKLVAEVLDWPEGLRNGSIAGVVAAGIRIDCDCRIKERHDCRLPPPRPT